MSASEAYSRRGFYRSSDRAVLGGVCAGMADYFGFNLRVLRILAIIAFIVAMPMAVIAYLAAVFLIPARSGTVYERVVVRQKPAKTSRRERRRARKEAKRQQEVGPSEAAIEVRDKCRSLDKRLADLEKHITSSRYQLDREIRNL
ncbi:MAG: PspC domain-containing protein [Woeseiaceae bacterium]